MYLFVDTETAGLPKRWKAPASEVNNWPRLVQIAWLLYDKKGTLIKAEDAIIIPVGFTIPRKTIAIHGISTTRAKKEGKDLKEVLRAFVTDLDKATYFVAHNLSFDERVIGAELIRNGISSSLGRKKRICTMKSTTKFCRIPGAYGYKWPTLSELYYAIFETDFDEAHNAKADIEATAKCFWALRAKGIL